MFIKWREGKSSQGSSGGKCESHMKFVSYLHKIICKDAWVQFSGDNIPDTVFLPGKLFQLNLIFSSGAK